MTRMSLPRNTAVGLRADATPGARNPLRRRVVMVGNLLASSGLFFFAACADGGLTEPGGPRAGGSFAAASGSSSPTTVVTSSRSTSRESSSSASVSSSTSGGSSSSTVVVSSSSSSSRGGDTSRVTLTISPTTTATFQVNVHRVRIAAGSICEPSTSGYGPALWDAPCTPAKGTVTVTAKAWTTAGGRPMVSFSPDVRFVPGKVNTIWLLDRTAAANKADPVTWCPTGQTTCVDESLKDASLKTSYTSDGYATRRIKHLSGFNTGFGRSSGQLSEDGED